MSVTFYPNYTQYTGFAAATEPTIAGESWTASDGTADNGSEGKPAFDIADNRRTNVLTIDTNSASTTIPIRVDVSASHINNFAIIDNHNLKSAGALFDIEQGGANITLTTSHSGALGAALGLDSAPGTPDLDGITLVKFDSAADTQWEVELDPDGGTYNADITIGEIVFGFSKTPAFNPELQPTFGYDMPGGSYRESEGGQRYGFSTHTNVRRSWRLMWKYMSDTNKADLEFVFKLTIGTRNPFYIDLSGPLGAATPQLFYVRFMKPLSFTGLTKDAWQVSVDIEEEI